MFMFDKCLLLDLWPFLRHLMNLAFHKTKMQKIGYILPCFLCYSFTENQIVVINQDLTFLFEIPQENLKITTNGYRMHARLTYGGQVPKKYSSITW